MWLIIYPNSLSNLLSSRYVFRLILQFYQDFLARNHRNIFILKIIRLDLILNRFRLSRSMVNPFNSPIKKKKEEKKAKRYYQMKYCFPRAIHYSVIIDIVVNKLFFILVISYFIKSI